jgi:hypothetical protein
LALPAGLGLVVRRVFVAVALRLVAVLDLAAVVFGLADELDLDVGPDLAVVLALLALVAVPADLAVVLDLAAEVLGVAAGALAADIVLAAAVSDLAALVMALVAVFIACMAVDMVLADDVALVAAAVILVAADVTLVAADETVRAATAADGALRLAVVRVDLLAVVLVLACVLGRLAVRLVALPLVDRARSLAGVRRVAVRALVRAGTDLPPSRSITEVLFHPHRRFTHR